MVHIWTDGATKYHKISRKKYDKIGHSFIGVVVKKNDVKIIEDFDYVGVLDNNQTEYLAFIKALKICIDNNYLNVTFHSDNNLLVQQIKGNYGVYSEKIISYYEEAVRYISYLNSYKIILISRKENKEADTLTKIAIEEFYNK